MSQKSYGLSDQVIARIAQVVQEGILMGVDIVDILRQVQVIPDDSSQTVIMTETYVKQVKDMHDKLLANVEEIKLQNDTKIKDSNIILN